LRIQLEIASLPPGFLSPQCEQVLRRFVREALVNVQKHAHASSVMVKLERLRNNRVRMSVRDDGRGSAMAGRWGASQATGFGLLSLCEQVEALGGQFRFDSAPNHGTVVWAVVPAAEANGENTHIDR
jgi:signal transduction histidine kinase